MVPRAHQKAAIASIALGMVHHPFLDRAPVLLADPRIASEVRRMPQDARTNPAHLTVAQDSTGEREAHEPRPDLSL